MGHSFRQQTVIRSFAFGFAATCALAGCATNGSVNPSTQSQLVSACDKAESAIAIAGFFQAKMTSAELNAYKIASDTDAKFCSASALASYGTPGAANAALAALDQVVADMQGVTDAKPATVSATPQ